MRVVMEELCGSNQILENNILTLHQRKHEDNHLEKDEIFDP